MGIFVVKLAKALLIFPTINVYVTYNYIVISVHYLHACTYLHKCIENSIYVTNHTTIYIYDSDVICFIAIPPLMCHSSSSM